jgi:hypothetical protein
MTQQNEGGAGTPPDAGQALQSIGQGLKNLFGGLLAKPGGGGAVVASSERSFTLRYNAESVTVKESDLPPGSTLPTVAEAFNTHGSRLGIESGRERTYRAGESVVDGSERVEWGNTYIAAVVRSTKG